MHTRRVLFDKVLTMQKLKNTYLILLPSISQIVTRRFLSNVIS